MRYRSMPRNSVIMSGRFNSLFESELVNEGVMYFVSVSLSLSLFVKEIIELSCTFIRTIFR